MVSIHWNWLINPRTWFCVFWLSLKMHIEVKNTRSLQKYHIQKSTSLQLWFIQEQNHNPLFFVRCPYWPQNLIRLSNIGSVSSSLLALLCNFVLRSLQIVLTLRWWRKGLFIEVEEKLIFEYDIFAKIWCLWPPYAFYWQSKDTESCPGIY